MCDLINRQINLHQQPDWVMTIKAPIPRNERRLMQKTKQQIHDKHHARRLTAMLMLHRGYTVTDVSQILYCARSSVGCWINRFTPWGAESQCSLSARRSRCWLFESVCPLLRELIKLTSGDFGYQRSHWRTELLAIKTNELTGLYPCRNITPLASRSRNCLAQSSADTECLRPA